ncbi:oligoendopeptidase F [Porticoccaceae bacterium]|nr:oligoendopeptidase F [Porticoccaceae bacterium]
MTLNTKNYAIFLLTIFLTACAGIGKSVEKETTIAAPINDRYIWDLSDLYPDLSAWEAARNDAAQQITQLEKFRGTLEKSSESFLHTSDQISTVYKEVVRIYIHASLRADTDTRNAENEERSQLAANLFTDFSAAISWYNPELLALGEEKIALFLEQQPHLSKHRFGVMDALRRAPHTRHQDIETFLAKTGQLTSAPNSIYSVFANANMPWPEVTLSNGKKIRLSQAGYSAGRQAASREDRKMVFDEFWSTWQDYEATLGAIMNAQIQGLAFKTEARNYESSLGRALFDDNMPPQVYETLVEEVNQSLPTLHRYFKLRKRMLGINDEMRYYDIYPPLVNLDKQFTIEDSITVTRRALKPLGSEYMAAYDLGVKSRWMHVFPSAGKRSGAYMSGGAYDVHPYVLLNHNNDFESASTFAHEYGHAVHSVLANTAQPWETASYSTFIAETASIMNEMLLQDMVIAEARSDEEKLFYLGIGLEALRGTFFRQTMFAEFELKINQEVEAGNVLTGSKLTSIYLQLLKRYHGHDQNVVTIDDLYGIEWAYIPHFYYDFYVFQYATSIAAASNLAKKIRSGDKKAQQDFIQLLKAGGSDYPYKLMQQAGIDMATAAPYRALVERMNKIMDEMETILDRRKNTE